ncbi:MAG: ABC transporter permease [Lachnospiraceae bacterium]|nr:ABC transporter permease [Lachnospiraceae bacterium]
MQMDVNKLLKYLILQCKRILHAVPAVLVISLLLAVVVGLLGAGMISKDASDEKMLKLEVGIVGDVSDSYLGFGIMAIRQLDSVRFAVNFEEMSRQEAEAALVSGDIDAFCVIPDGFVDSIVSGDNMQITCYSSNGQLGLGTMVLQEILQAVSEMVVQSQGAIYSMQTICREHGLDNILWEATDELNLEYISFIINRDQIYDLKLLGISDQLSMVGYYICGIAVLFFLIWGVNGCPLFVRRDMSLAKLLAANGRGAISQVLCEYIAYLLLMTISFLGLVVLAGGICEGLDLSFDEWKRIDFEVVLSFAIRLLPAAAMLTAMALLGHELVSNAISGMLLQFLGAMVMGYLSGCLYPRTFLPEAMQILGEMLPSGVALTYASGCMREVYQVGNILCMLGYTCVFIVLTIALRYRKLLRN